MIVLVLFFLQCGLAPLPPLPPIGCKDMEPVCICDSEGDCDWKFVCVRDE